MNVIERAKALADELAVDARCMETTDSRRDAAIARKLSRSHDSIQDLLSIVERLQGVGGIGFTADGKVVIEGDALHWPDGSEATFSHAADTGGARFRTMPKRGEILGELVSANNAYSTRAAAEAAREGE